MERTTRNFTELRLNALPALPQVTVLGRIARRLWENEDVAALWLGGSFAREEADEHSDLDLRVAVRPDTQPQNLDPPELSALLGETVVGTQSLSWEGTVLHHLLLAGGVIMDLLVQHTEREPPQDYTLVLGCRDAVFGALLAAAHLPAAEDLKPADPQAICEAVTQFWIGSHKHVRMLHRDLDLLILIGLGFEQPVLMRLWYVAATGRDQGTQRPTIHTLTPQVRAVTEMFGAHSLETLGSARTSRTEILRAVEANRDEAARVGRRLAATLGFEYPDALEQTVRASWKLYLKGQK